MSDSAKNGNKLTELVTLVTSPFAQRTTKKLDFFHLFARFPNEEVELRALSLKDVKDIHDLYPAGNMESIKVFEKLLERLPGCGVFAADNGELLAWMVQSYYGAMFSMQTKPDHRRKGYGIWLAKTLTEIVIKRGYLPFVVIRPENNASKGLYKKLGFKKKFNVVRAIFTPLEKPISIN